jgi:phage terminase large subunit
MPATPHNNIDEAKVIGMPDGFAATMLGMELYPRQCEVLRALWPPGAVVSFRSCNEGGKTKRVICAAILWHLMAFPKGHVISTSGSYRQIKDQLLPALHAFENRFPNWKFLRTPRIETESMNCFWEGFSTDEAGKFEGHHADGPDQPLLIIVDEAKTVKDDIFEAIERCKPTRLLIASSPGYAEGEFYRSHTTRAKFYRTFVQRAPECPHWKPADMDRLREKWGADHPLYRSMVMAEFMDSVADAVIDLKALEDLMTAPPMEKRGGSATGLFERKAFCDFAWSGDGDENVLALRDGNVVTLEETFRADNLHAICGRFIAAFNRLGLKAHEIDGDEGGGGKLICDQLQAMGWRIHRVNNGAAPRSSGHYANLAAEMWFEGAQQIVRREIVLPDDDDLRAQMLDRKRVPNARGKLAVESKHDMKKRGVNSPDRADAVFGAMMPLRRVTSISLGNRGPAGSFTEQLRDFCENEAAMEGQLPGAYFG